LPNRTAHRALSLYVALVVAAGGLVVVRSIVELTAAPRPVEWLLFTILAILTGSFTIRIASTEASISVADTFFITSALLFGPAACTVAVALDSFILSYRRRHSIDRIAFNTVAPALSLWCGATVFFAMTGASPLAAGPFEIGPLILPLVAMTLVYFGLNSGLLAVAIGLEARQSPVQVWRRHLLTLSLGYFAAGSVALSIVAIIQEAGVLAVAVVLPVLAVFHLTLKSSFGRLEDANRHIGQMDRLYMSTVQTLAMAIDAKDDVTHNHVQRVQSYAEALAHALHVEDEPTLKAIQTAALLHDTGKLAVPEHILNKPGGLTPAEFEQMKRHVDVGADILSLVNFPYPVVPIVRCHHENWDGSGYPRGLSGSEIPIGARILSVVDCYDALTSDRPYRRALSDEAAVEILGQRRGTMYDPAVVDMFLAIRHEISRAGSSVAGEMQTIQQLIRPKRSESSDTASSPEGACAALPPVQPDLPSFASLARLVSGSSTCQDVVNVASGLLASVVPGVTITGAWYVADEDGEHLSLVGATGPHAAHVLPRVRIREGVTGWVAAHHRPIVNADPRLDFGSAGSPAQVESCLSVPLSGNASVAGVLTLYAKDRQPFTDDQARTLQSAAPHLLAALGAAAAPRQPNSRDLKLVSSR
jgi:putative nucleotidyltransferase with HDIG domain